MNIKLNFKIIVPALLMLVVLAIPVASFAQKIKATAKLDSNEIQIGQQVKLELSIQYRVDNGKRIQVLWPEIADTIRKEVEVVSQSKIDTIVDKNDPFLFTQTQILSITSFDSGYWAIPPFKFLAGDTNGVYTDPLLLQVSTMTVDTTQAIKDIKEPYEQTYNWMDWIKDNMLVVWVILGAILVIVILLLIFKYTRKVKPVMVEVEIPKIPAHIIAFEKLDDLKTQNLWQEGKLKLYHSQLTDIIREYIENRYKIQAMEQTTDEILFGFRNVAIDEDSKSKLKQVLLLADLVKFAKEQPLPTENDLSMSNSYAFINGTKKDEEITDKKKIN
ncbi:MAG: hypothetical protein IPP64_05995 [Bacteroidetes bacterium]|nr:hypothetical protein [Bacteroidota bacterium]